MFTLNLYDSDNEEDTKTKLKVVLGNEICEILSLEKIHELCDTIEKKIKKELIKQFQFIKDYRKQGNINFQMPINRSEMYTKLHEVNEFDIEKQIEISEIQNINTLAQITYRTLRNESIKNEYLRLGMSDNEIINFFLCQKEFDFIKRFVYNNSLKTKKMMKELIDSLEKLENDIENQHNFQKKLHNNLKNHKLYICSEIDSITECPLRRKKFIEVVNTKWISVINIIINESDIFKTIPDTF